MKRAEELVPLSWDHHHGLVMARRIAREAGGAADEVEALYSDLVAFWSAGLLPHFRVEGECLLGRLIRHIAAGAPEPRRMLNDHLELAGLVATMRDTTDTEIRRDSLRQFGERLLAHIRWEEDVLFELAQQQLTGAEMRALGEDVRAALPHLVAAPKRPQSLPVIP